MNNLELSDKEKQALSFLVALAVPWSIAILMNLFIQNSAIMVVIGVGVSAWTLVGGLQKNSELEWSIGGLLGQMTSWVIPSGISWWFPRPFGQAFKRTHIGTREIDHTRRSHRQLTDIVSHDGTHVAGSYFALYRISDLLTWVSVNNPHEAIEAIIERAIRWFVSEHDVIGENNLVMLKGKMTEYLSGKSVWGRSGEMVSDISEVLLRKVGVTLISIQVDDINPPPTLVQANEAAVREIIESTREQRDIQSLTARVKEMSTALGLDPSEALRAVQAARGDIEVIDVRGGGDFSKGAAIHRSNKKV